MADEAFGIGAKTCADTDIPKRKYVCLISGTMNPPHSAHIKFGLFAAAELVRLGHEVSSVCYVPVHDNYLHNKVSLQEQTAREQGKEPSLADAVCCPMALRCKLTKMLLEQEPDSKKFKTHVLDYEHEFGQDLLEPSPGYWAPRLKEGYFKTVPSVNLIKHFANSTQAKGSRVCAVFGIDNFPSMTTWNNPGELLSCADLALVGRQMPKVELKSNPEAFFSAVRYLNFNIPMPVSYQGKELCGSEKGSFVNQKATRSDASSLIITLSSLEGQEAQSSSAMREAFKGLLDAFETHGYTEPKMFESAMEGVLSSRANLKRMGEASQKRGERLGGGLGPATAEKTQAAEKTSGLERGMRLQAEYGGVWYLAEVKGFRKGKVKVSYVGHDEEEWVGMERLRSKALQSGGADDSQARGKFPRCDLSGLTKGMRLQAEFKGVWYVAEVLAVNPRKAAPVKIAFVGHDSCEEWLSVDRLRSKAILR